jgi:short-subunit dehydrogenase
MKILITGASSIIGESLAAAFSPGNDLLLLGRNSERLKQVQERCLQQGASKVNARAVDISRFSQEEWSELTTGMNLIVHGAFSHSGKRDDQITSFEFYEMAFMNLVSPARLFLAATAQANPGTPIGIILISSFLAKIRSPNRLIYGSFKLLQEEYLRSICRNHPAVQVMIVNVSTPIPTDHNSRGSDALAVQVVRAFGSGKTHLAYGHLGSLLTALFYVQPLIYFLVSASQRWLRKQRFRPRATPPSR